MTWLQRLTTRATGMDWSRVLRADPCSWCGEPGGTVEHLQPRSRGGGNTPDNMVGACRRCNGERGLQPILRYLIVRQRPWLREADRVCGLSRRLRPESPPPPLLQATIAERLGAGPGRRERRVSSWTS